jgi:plastocyanin
MHGNFSRRTCGAGIAVVFFGLMFIVPAADAQDAKTAAVTDVTVTIDNFAFTPAELKIAPGTRVTFVNHDDIPHTVVAADKTFRSKVLDTNDQYQFTFEKAGDIAYFCSLHPHMKGKIVVSP